MSLQSNTSIWKWKFTTIARQSAYFSTVLGLFLAFSFGYSQTATRTSLSVHQDGNAVKLSVAVKGQLGAPVSGGSVSFMSGSTSLGSAFVDASGNATLSLDKLPSTTKQITAVYSGTETFATSSSVSAQADATGTGVPDFAITAQSTSLSVNIGDYVSTILTVTPENCPASNPDCFTQSVALSISGLPNASQAIFAPTSVIPSTGPVNSTLQIQTQGPSGGKQSSIEHASSLTYAMAFPGILALAGMGALRKRKGAVRLLGIAALLAASFSGLTACSQRYSYLHHPPSASVGTPAGSYPLTITAYSNNGGEVTSHTLALTLVVK